MNAAREESVHWRKKLLPSGKAGRNYIDKTAWLIGEWVNDSPLYDLTESTNGHTISFPQTKRNVQRKRALKTSKQKIYPLEK